MDIKSFNLKKEILNYLENKKIFNFLPVQDKVIPSLINKKDSFVESPTGTGKTLSFLIPILNNLNISEHKIQSIIITPTRELSIQIKDVLKEMLNFYKKEINLTLAISGKDFNDQFRKINNGTHIIIGTMDRVNSLLNKSKKEYLNKLKYLIIDEIDMVINFNGLSEVKKFLEKISKEVVLGFFSATFPIEFQNFVKKNLKRNILNIIIKNNDKLISYFIRAFDNNKFYTLEKLIKSDIFNPFFCLIFAKTNEEVEEIYKKLKIKGVKNIAAFNSKISKRERNRLLKLLNNNSLVYLVTTDLMSRGIDFKSVTHIINYSLPVDLVYYKHRIGRTNRNFLKGNIYDIYLDSDLKKYQEILNKNKNIIFKKMKI